MKSVLITGANGFIGRHLIEKFLKEGYTVLAGVREKSDVSRIEHFPIEVVRLDYLNLDKLKTQLKTKRFSVVVHNAGVTVSKTEDGYFQGNTFTTKNLLEAVREHGIQHFTYVSSLAARGPGNPPSDEPISPYGLSKLKAEEMVKSSGLSYSIVRPTAVYGPGDAAFEPVFSWAKRGVFLQLGSSKRKMTFVHAHHLSSIIFHSMEKTNQTVYGWDGENYLQRDLTVSLKRAANRSGIVLTLPAWLFQSVTWLVDVMVRRLLGQFWDYPPMKVAELIADDWSILGDNKPHMENLYKLEEGFTQTYNHWIATRK